MSFFKAKNHERFGWFYWYIFLAVVATILVYGFGLKSPFQFDDLANISKNFNIRKIDFFSQIMNDSRWLGEMINRINFKIGEFNPFSYRLINLLIHLCSGLVVLFFSKCIFEKKSMPVFLQKNKYFIAALTFIFFLLHPVQTQTVSYVIQGRLEGLATFFSLLSVWFFVLALEQVVFRKKLAFFFFAELFLFLGLSNKEIAVVTPALGFLTDIFWISNFSWEKFRKNLWLHLAYLFLPIIFMLYFFSFSFFQNIFTFSLVSHNNRGNILTNLATEKITTKQFLFSQFGVILHYLWMFFVPISLCVEYEFFLPSSFFSPSVFLPFFVLFLLCLCFFVKAKNDYFKIFSFGFFWFMLAILPRSSIVPCAELACDYKTYLGSFGIFLGLATGLCLFIEKIIVFFRKNFSGLWFADHFFLPVFILLGGVFSFSRNKVWSNQIFFWQDIVSKNPSKARPLNNLGVALTEAGRYDEAILAYEKAIKIDKYYPDPLSNLAVVFSYKEKYNDAIAVLERAIQILPNYPEGYNNLAALLFKINKISEAEELLQHAIKLRPFYGKAHYNLGRCFLARGESEKAWESFKKATEGDLDTKEGFLFFGGISQQLNKHQEAVFAFQQAIKKGDTSLETFFCLANSLFCLNKFVEAEAVYKKILNHANPDLRVVCNLGETFFMQNKFDEALKLYGEFSLNFKEYPQAMFRKVHCLEKTFGIDSALAFLEENKAIGFSDETKESLRNELGRLRLQKKINGGNCSLTGQEFQNLFSV